jgi:hypothetical protein
VTAQRTTMVAVGASIAALVYSGSLVAQRFVPALKDVLALSFDNVRPTYYLRVISSLVVGGVAAFVGRRRVVPERRLAWGMAITVAVSVVLACACP